MTIRKVLPLLFLFFSKNLTPQTIEVGEWLGDWESTFEVYDSTYIKTVENLIIKEIHKRKFVQMELNRSSARDTGSAFKYASTIVLTVSVKEKKIAGWMIDDYGFDGMMQLDGEITGSNKLTLNGESPLYSLQETWELRNDGRLYRMSKVNAKQSGLKSITETIFVRKN